MTALDSRDARVRPVEFRHREQIVGRPSGNRLRAVHGAQIDSSRPGCFGRLLKSLRNKGRSREDAEDLIQEAMLRLLVYANGDAVVNQEAFLRLTVHNLAIDQYRHDCLGLGREVRIEDIDRQSPLTAPGPTPDQILDNQQRLDHFATLYGRGDPTDTRDLFCAPIRLCLRRDRRSHGHRRDYHQKAHCSCAIDHHGARRKGIPRREIKVGKRRVG